MRLRIPNEELLEAIYNMPCPKCAVDAGPCLNMGFIDVKQYRKYPHDERAEIVLLPIMLADKRKREEVRKNRVNDAGIICCICKNRKAHCLFTPSQIARSSAVCRKCGVERNGSKFGDTAAIGRGYMRLQKALDAQDRRALSVSFAKKDFRDAETKRLVEARNRRLNSSSPDSHSF